MTPRCYSFDGELLAAIEDAKSNHGIGKAEAVRRLCKAGLDNVQENGWDSLPPDKERRYDGPPERNNTPTNGSAPDGGSGANGVEVDESGGASDSRALPGNDVSVGDASAEKAHAETAQPNEETGTARDRTSGGILPNWLKG